MRMGYRAHNIEKKPNARVHVELLLVTILIDRQSFDIFKDEIGFSIGCHASIHQFCDMRMSELTENLALTRKPLDAYSRGHRKSQKLDRYATIEAAIASLSQPHAAHPALANQRHQAVCPDFLVDYRQTTGNSNR